MNRLSELPMPKFEYVKTGHKNARIGEITTAHGVIKTPAFVFCATRGAIKGLTISDMLEAKTQVVLSNTYHLMLRPGGKYVENLGGIQKFIGWNGPMLTDSGGYQVFSLNNNDVNKVDELKRKYSGTKNNSGIIKISEEGIVCKSYYDGSEFFLSPETSMQVQIELGADLIVVLDECTKFSDDKDFNKSALDRNHRWAVRSLNYAKRHKKDWQGVYGIVHGGTFHDLRKLSAEFNNDNNFFGHAIGGSLGRNKSEMEEVVGVSMDNLIPERPVHLLGIGGISDIFMGIEHGIDTFDCVHPTRIARHGGALIKRKKRNDIYNFSREFINLRNSTFKNVDNPIEEDCTCKTCRLYSVGYLNYLLSVKEPIVFNLLTYHNVHFMNTLMSEIRESLTINSINELRIRYS